MWTLEIALTVGLIGLLLLATLLVFSPWFRLKLVKAGVLTVALLGLVGGYFVVTLPLGQPKLVSLEFLRSLDNAVVVWGELIEDTGIFLALRLPSEPVARYYWLEWDEKTAEALRAAQAEAAETHGTVRMQPPSDGSLDDREKMFHALPPPPLPRKEGPPPARRLGA